MQNTRLNTVFDRLSDRLGGFFRNPWRRLSLILISLLLGNFLGTAISTISGQKADLDIVVAAFLVVLLEGVSWVAYGGGRERSRSLLIQLLNATKIGITYSLFVEAFKLGS
jgi:Protein of unknown function (DUF565)